MYEIELFVRVYIDAEVNGFFLCLESQHSYLLRNWNLVISLSEVLCFDIFLARYFLQYVLLFLLHPFFISQNIMLFLFLDLFSKTVLFFTCVEVADGDLVDFL